MKKKLTLTNQNENEQTYQATFMEKIEGAPQDPSGKIAAKSQIVFTCTLLEKPAFFKTGNNYSVTIDVSDNDSQE